MYPYNMTKKHLKFQTKNKLGKLFRHFSNFVNTKKSIIKYGI